MVNRHLPSALWLLFALPRWYFSAAAHPVQGGIFTFIPFIGTLGLIAGAIASLAVRKRESMLFVFPLFTSQCFVALAGLLRGELRGNLSVVPMLLFALAQLVLIGYLGYKVREVRVAALALPLFSASYALFALLVSGMAFADSWL